MDFSDPTLSARLIRFPFTMIEMNMQTNKSDKPDLFVCMLSYVFVTL